MNKKAFTLVELLVWITILIIIALSIGNVNFISMSDKQKLESFNNKIISEIESIRNDALIWKWMWNNILAPLSWKIDFSKNGWWSIQSSYYDWTNWILKENISIPANTNIEEIKCTNYNDSISVDLSWTQVWTIIFEKWTYRLSWNCPPNYTNLKIKIHNKLYYEDFTFNTISWTIKR